MCVDHYLGLITMATRLLHTNLWHANDTQCCRLDDERGVWEQGGLRVGEVVDDRLDVIYTNVTQRGRLMGMCEY